LDSHPIIVKSDCSNCGKSMQALVFPTFNSMVPSDLLIQVSVIPECTEKLFHISADSWVYCNECQKGEN
jgi:hypothetical protein